MPYDTYLNVLQVSSVHAYLTYPFVASWSLLEAMSVRCVVIGSDTAPVQEFIDGDNGMLTPFFDVAQWSDRIVDVLRNPARYQTMRAKAREFIDSNFNADTICVPQMMSILQEQSFAAPPVRTTRLWPGKIPASQERDRMR